MKKLSVLMVLVFCAVGLYAQNDVTTFLGIPVDGSKKDMIRKLEGKGYVYDNVRDVLTGEFNGRDVIISVVTNNNKVYRICLQDANYVSETDVRIRFNTLCRQFKNNERYFSGLNESIDYTIDEDEDISYEMVVKNKRYQAAFYQRIDTAEMKTTLLEWSSNRYGEEELANLTERQQEEMVDEIINKTAEIVFSKEVWFMIDEKYGRYGVLMYYDNKFNQANGKDL